VATLQDVAPPSTAASCSLQPSSLLAPPHTVFRTMLTNRNEDLSDSQVSHEEGHNVMEGTNRSVTNHRLSRPAGEFEIGRDCKPSALDCNLVHQHSTYFTMYHRSLRWMLITRGIIPHKATTWQVYPSCCLFASSPWCLSFAGTHLEGSRALPRSMFVRSLQQTRLHIYNGGNCPFLFDFGLCNSSLHHHSHQSHQIIITFNDSQR